jgi:hypothetical protein
MSLHGILGVTEPDTSDDTVLFGITFRRIKWMLSGFSDLTRLHLVMKSQRQDRVVRVSVLDVYTVNRYWECRVVSYDSSASLPKSEISFRRITLIPPEKCKFGQLWYT